MLKQLTVAVLVALLLGGAQRSAHAVAPSCDAMYVGCEVPGGGFHEYWWNVDGYPCDRPACLCISNESVFVYGVFYCCPISATLSAFNNCMINNGGWYCTTMSQCM